MWIVPHVSSQGLRKLCLLQPAYTNTDIRDVLKFRPFPTGCPHNPEFAFKLVIAHNDNVNHKYELSFRCQNLHQLSVHIRVFLRIHYLRCLSRTSRLTALQRWARTSNFSSSRGPSGDDNCPIICSPVRVSMAIMGWWLARPSSSSCDQKNMAHGNKGFPYQPGWMWHKSNSHKSFKSIYSSKHLYLRSKLPIPLKELRQAETDLWSLVNDCRVWNCAEG